MLIKSKEVWKCMPISQTLAFHFLALYFIYNYIAQNTKIYKLIRTYKEHTTPNKPETKWKGSCGLHLTKLTSTFFLPKTSYLFKIYFYWKIINFQSPYVKLKEQCSLFKRTSKNLKLRFGDYPQWNINFT